MHRLASWTLHFICMPHTIGRSRFCALIGTTLLFCEKAKTTYQNLYRPSCHTYFRQHYPCLPRPATRPKTLAHNFRRLFVVVVVVAVVFIKCLSKSYKVVSNFHRIFNLIRFIPTVLYISNH